MKQNDNNDFICFLQVLLKTTAGDIDIELWSKEAPKACRNFIQLCLEGNHNYSVLFCRRNFVNLKIAVYFPTALKTHVK